VDFVTSINLIIDHPMSWCMCALCCRL